MTLILDRFPAGQQPMIQVLIRVDEVGRQRHADEPWMTVGDGGRGRLTPGRARRCRRRKAHVTIVLRGTVLRTIENDPAHGRLLVGFENQLIIRVLIR